MNSNADKLVGGEKESATQHSFLGQLLPVIYQLKGKKASPSPSERGMQTSSKEEDKCPTGLQAALCQPLSGI